MESNIICPLYYLGNGCKTGKAVGETRCTKYKLGCATFVFYNQNEITWSEYCLRNSVSYKERCLPFCSDISRIVEQHFQDTSGKGNSNGNGSSNGNGKTNKVSSIAASFA